MESNRQGRCFKPDPGGEKLQKCFPHRHTSIAFVLTPLLNMHGLVRMPEVLMFLVKL